MRGYKAATWGDGPESVRNSADNPLFHEIELNWRRPTIWSKAQAKPEFEADEPFLYILLRDHGNARRKDQIVYVGLTRAPKTRFGNHETAKAIVARRGTVRFTYAPVPLSGRNRVERIRLALEGLEHLLIWALPDQPLENERKQFTLPGMGSNGGNAWRVRNTGYRFSGQMPREVVFPWMLLRPGRNRSKKAQRA